MGRKNVQHLDTNTPENRGGERSRLRKLMPAAVVGLLTSSLLIPSAYAQDSNNGDSGDNAETPLTDAMIESQSLEASTLRPLDRGTITDFYLPQGEVTVVGLTLTETTGTGYVQIVSGGVAIGETSNANSSYAYQTTATLGIVTPDANGHASIYNQVGTHVIVDEQGTFKDGAVEVVKPKRMFDSRDGGRPQLKPGSKTVVGGFKPNSTALINITTTDTICDGYIQIMDSLNGPIGAYSNANAMKGNTIPKVAAVKTNANGEVVLYSSCETHAIIDLQAYLNGVDDIADQRVIDTRESKQLNAGTILELNARPNSIAMVSVLTMNSRSEGYIQALPVENPVIGKSSNMNLSTVPNSVVGGFMFVEIGPDGKGRLFVQSQTDMVVDIAGYMSSDAISFSPERLVDTREAIQNRPNNPVCEKVVMAVGATATGTIEGLTYNYVVIDGNGNVEATYPAPGLNLDNAGNFYAIDPTTCNNPNGPSFFKAVGNYPGAELYRTDLATGQTVKVQTPIGKYERPEPQAEGLVALQTDNGLGGKYLGIVTNLAKNTRTFPGSAKDFSQSDNGTTNSFLQSYFSGFLGGDNKMYDALFVEKYNPVTKKFETLFQQLESPDIYHRINDIETSPGGETTAVLRNNGSPVSELAVAKTGPGASISLEKVNLPSTFQPIGFKLADADTAIVAVIDNGPGGPILRTLSVNPLNGSYTVINTGPAGSPIDIGI